MDERIKKLAMESMHLVYTTSAMKGKYLGARREDLLDMYMMGYYQGVSDTAVDCAKRGQSLFTRIKNKIKYLFVLPDETAKKYFENDRRCH